MAFARGHAADAGDANGSANDLLAIDEVQMSTNCYACLLAIPVVGILLLAMSVLHRLRTLFPLLSFIVLEHALAHRVVRHVVLALLSE